VKILQITPAYKPAFIYGGPTMSVAMLTEQMAAAGVETEVYTTTANGQQELKVVPGLPTKVDGVTVRYFKRLTGDHTHFSPTLLWQLWKNIKKYDVVHIHAWWNSVSMLSCLIAVIRGKKVVLSPRGMLSDYSFHNKNLGAKRILHVLLGKPLLKRCHIHATSEWETRSIQNAINPASIAILPNFVRVPTNPEGKKHMLTKVMRLAFFSRIEHKKGLDLLINALPLLDFDYQLTIAGNGENSYVAELKQLSIKNNVDHHIRWAGFLGNEKFTFLADHDLLVLPSYDENFANVIIESLSEGTAVLISNQVGLSKYVSDQNFGWLCEPSVVSIADVLRLIRNQKEELSRIRIEAPTQIRKDFDNSRLARRYKNLYEGIH
jgi:glycosyltransferase involved in cell wall biosynthesis